MSLVVLGREVDILDLQSSQPLLLFRWQSVVRLLESNSVKQDADIGHRLYEVDDAVDVLTVIQRMEEEVEAIFQRVEGRVVGGALTCCLQHAMWQRQFAVADLEPVGRSECHWQLVRTDSLDHPRKVIWDTDLDHLLVDALRLVGCDDTISYKHLENPRADLSVVNEHRRTHLYEDVPVRTSDRTKQRRFTALNERHGRLLLLSAHTGMVYPSSALLVVEVVRGNMYPILFR